MMWLALALVLGAEQAPARRVSRVETERIAYTVTQVPGIGAAGQVIELMVRMEELTKAPDPSFGRQRLATGASVVAYMVSAHGEVTDARVAAQDGDEGNFALHFTPTKDGVYTVHLIGTSAAGVVPYAVLMPVNVWPLPSSATPTAIPKKLPYPTIGDLAHGKLVCARDCQGVGDMSSESAGALDDATLLVRLAPSARAARLVDRDDLLAFVRSQFVGVRDFFPDAATYVIEKRGLDSEAVARVKVLSGQEPATHEGNVFVVYKGQRAARIEPSRHVDVRSRAAGDRLGYVVYDGELAIALSPSLAIVGARARTASGIRETTADRAAIQRAVALTQNLLDEERERAESGPRQP